MKKYKYLIISKLIFISILTSCSKSTNETSEKPVENIDLEVTLSDKQMKNAGIQLGSLTSKNLSEIVTVTGVLDVPPKHLVTISLPISGNVSETFVIQGSHIHKGQLLATIESQEFISIQQEYLAKLSQSKLLKAELDRQTLLAKEQVNSNKVYQQAQTDFEINQNLMKSFQLKLEMLGYNIQEIEKNGIQRILKIKSPIDGFITVMNINLGKFVMSNDVLFELVNLDHLHAELSVFEKDIMKVEDGQKVEFSPLDNENQVFEASVYLINHKINSDRTVQVHVHIHDKVQNLLPGMNLKAKIYTQSRQRTVINQDALCKINNQDYLFVKTEAKNTFKALLVKKGISANNMVEIMNATDFEGKEMVIEGAFNLQSALLNKEEE